MRGKYEKERKRGTFWAAGTIAKPNALLVTRGLCWYGRSEKEGESTETMQEMEANLSGNTSLNRI